MSASGLSPTKTVPWGDTSSCLNARLNISGSGFCYDSLLPLAIVRQGRLTSSAAQNRALSVGIEMQIAEDEDGEQTISFFGYQKDTDTLIGKLIVFEPPDLVWN